MLTSSMKPSAFFLLLVIVVAALTEFTMAHRYRKKYGSLTRQSYSKYGSRQRYTGYTGYGYRSYYGKRSPVYVKTVYVPVFVDHGEAHDTDGHFLTKGYPGLTPTSTGRNYPLTKANGHHNTILTNLHHQLNHNDNNNNNNHLYPHTRTHSGQHTQGYGGKVAVVGGPGGGLSPSLYGGGGGGGGLLGTSKLGTVSSSAGLTGSYGRTGSYGSTNNLLG